MLKILIEKTLVNVTCIYASQVGLSNYNKDAFYEQLLTYISSVEEYEIHIIAGDFNGHVRKESVTFDTCHGGKGYCCSVTDLAGFNTFFDKNQNKLITFSSVDNNSQFDYILVKTIIWKKYKESIMESLDNLIKGKLLSDKNI